MPLSHPCRLLLLLLLSLSACKKSGIPAKGGKDQTLPANFKNITVIQGNNQTGYVGKTLQDTIVIKVSFDAVPASDSLSFYFKGGGNSESFYIYSKKVLGNDIYIKGTWRPDGSTYTPTATFYTYRNCTTEQLAKGTCASLDSVRLSAHLRKPWANVYRGSQGGYNVLQDLHFMDEKRGIAVGEGSGVIRTADGGKNWTMGEPVRSDNSAYLLAFTGRDTALVNIVNNYVYFTYDGGKTFFQPAWTPPLIGHLSSSAYYLQSRNTIFSVGRHGGIAKTTDGGLHWDLSGSLNVLNNLYDIACIGKDTLYACGDIGLLVKSTDAGKTWKQQPLQINNNLSRLYFLNGRFGFAAGQYGLLIRTTDGGEHWATIQLGLSFPVIAIRFFGEKHGFLVSAGGEVAESKDGGLTWSVKNISNYGAGDLRRAVIKDETTVFGLQQSSILTYDLTQQ